MIKLLMILTALLLIIILADTLCLFIGHFAPYKVEVKLDNFVEISGQVAIALLIAAIIVLSLAIII